MPDWRTYLKDFSLPIEGHIDPDYKRGLELPEAPPEDAIKSYGGEFKVLDDVNNDPEVAAVVEGYFTTPDVDESNQITLPTAFVDSLPFYMSNNPVLLLNHDQVRLPIGQVIYYRIEEAGVFIRGIIEGLTQRGRDTAALAKSKRRYIRDFSFMWRPTKMEPGRNGSPDVIIETKMYEISLCNIGMNLNAQTTRVKKLFMNVGLLPEDYNLDNNNKPNRSNKMAKEKQTPEEEIKKIRDDIESSTKAVKGELKKEIDALRTSEEEFEAWRKTADTASGEIEKKIDKLTKTIQDKQKDIDARIDDVIEKSKISQAGNYVDADHLLGDFKSLMTAPEYELKAAFEGNDFRSVSRLKSLYTGLSWKYKLLQAKGEIGRDVSFDDAVKSMPEARELDRVFQKVMYTTATGYGAEFIDEVLVATLKEKYRSELRVAGLFETRPMASDPDKVTAEGADVEAIKVTERTTDVNAFPTNLQTPGTRQVTFTGATMRAACQVSHKNLKWAVHDLNAYIEMKLKLGLYQAKEKAVINGQSSGAIDTGVASTDASMLVDGLRKLCPTATKVDLATFSESQLNLIDVAMDNMADPEKCSYILSYRTLYKHFKMLENFRTMDKVGDRATIIKGMIASYEGKSLIPSAYVQNNLDSNGVYPGAGNTKSLLILVNRGRWAFGDPDDFELAVNYYPDVRSYQIFAFDSFAFSPWDDLTSDYSVGLGINIS